MHRQYFWTALMPFWCSTDVIQDAMFLSAPHLPLICLKEKFSSGIEGALASTLNNDFNWKQLSEMILFIFLLMFSYFIWVTLIQKQQKYK